jgi:hypothetical protein
MDQIEEFNIESKWYRRTKELIIRNIYYSQIKSSKSRNHPLPNYTVTDFIFWFHMQPNNDELVVNYIKSLFKKTLAPSGDRLDSSKSYTLDNLRLVTWQENMDANIKDMKKAVMEYDMDLNFIKRHTSISEAERLYDIPNAMISRSCVGHNAYSKERIWLFEGDDTEEELHKRREAYLFHNRTKLTEEVIQLDIDGNFVKEWPSLHEVNKSPEFIGYQISRGLKDKIKVNGFYFLYKSNYNEESVKELLDKSKNRYEKFKKKVYQYDKNGKFVAEYNSLGDIKTVDGKDIKKSSIALCAGRRTHLLAYGYIWVYDDRNTEEYIRSFLTKIYIPIDVYKDGVFLKHYTSLYDKEIYDVRYKILAVCKGKTKEFNGCVFKFSNYIGDIEIHK